MKKKIITGFCLIGCISVGILVVKTTNENKDYLYAKNQEILEEKRAEYINFEGFENIENMNCAKEVVYGILLNTTNGIVNSITNDFETIEVTPKQALQYYASEVINENPYALKNIREWLNGDFSNVVEFHNKLDNILNEGKNQVTEANTEAIDAYKEYLGV
ncbi:DUF6241 domain-containing protein [uncultured Clostridium sp.]|uniref:DUF6241 domain-containing protein n=1 Tax=uncultured Clostridium sp. TaxID=59620 RepID=UPI0025EBFD29|nr:DUF6241 domain-containing protein [uncultured Clostridium sp.]